MDIKSLKKFIKKHWVTITLSVIVIFGFILRIFHLGDQSYWIDEGFTLNAVLETLEKGYPILDSGVHYARELLNTYLIAASVKLFGFNPWATRIVSVLFGTGFIVLIYFFVRDLFQNKKMALLASFLVSVSYWEIVWSRQARMYVLLQFFFFASLYTFWLLMDKYSHKRMILLSFSTLAACLCHPFGYLLLIIYVLIGVLNFINPLEKKKILQKRRSKVILNIQRYKWYYLIFSVIVIPLVGIEFYKIFLVRYFDNGLGISDNYTTFLYLKGLVQFYTIPVVLTLLGLFLYISRENKLFVGFYLFLSYLLPFFIVIRTTNLFHLRYLFFIFPILLIFSAYFIYQVLVFGSKTKYLVYLVIILLIAGAVGVRDFVVWPRPIYQLEFRTPNPNFTKAYRVIRESGWQDNRSVIVSPYTQMDMVYLGKTDFYLPISLTGLEDGLKGQIMRDNRNVYNNSPVIQSNSDLKQLHSGEATFIVIDAMARQRINIETLEYILGNTELIWQDIRGLNSIWVYRMKNLQNHKIIQ